MMLGSKAPALHCGKRLHASTELAQPATRRKTIISRVCARAQQHAPAPASQRNEDLHQFSTGARTTADTSTTTASKRGVLTGAAAVCLSLVLPSGGAQAAGDKVFFDIKLEGQDLGRIVVQVYDQPAIGTARFRDLAVGKEGVHYQLSRFDGIFPTYLRVSGVRSLSYTASAESPITGGDSLDTLQQELDAQQQRHDQPGLVSLIVKEAQERPVKERVTAKGGKLVTIAEQAGEGPNGTQFTITRGPSEELDRTNLIVGRVVEGMDVVDTIAAQPYAKPRESLYDGPFFSAAKAIGDKRATTAEKGFNRPLKRIIVANSGAL